MEVYSQLKPRAWIGRTLISDFYNDEGLLLLSAGHVLREEDIAKLFQHRITLTELHLEPLSVQAEVLRALEESVSTIQGLFEEIRDGAPIPIVDIRNEVLPAIMQSTEQIQVFPLLVSMYS